MNPYGWNLNPMGSYPSEQLNSVRRWNIPLTMTNLDHLESKEAPKDS